MGFNKRKMKAQRAAAVEKEAAAAPRLPVCICHSS
jgi:hypothetical protein